MPNPVTQALFRCATLALLCVAAAAQSGTALVGGRLIDGFGHRPIADSVILVDDGVITEVGTVDTLPVPAGERSLRLK